MKIVKNIIMVSSVAVLVCVHHSDVLAQANGNFRVEGRRIQKWDPASQAYQDHLFKGMNWNAYPVGTLGTFPDQFGFLCAWAGGANICPAGYNLYDFDAFEPIMARDFPLISLVGANTIHVYGRATSQIFPLSPLLAFATVNNLDVLVHYPVATVDFTDINQQNFFINDFAAYVTAVENDPFSSVVVGYVFGNEVTHRLCCGGGTAQVNAFYRLLDRAAANAKTNNPNVLITTMIVDIGDIQTYDSVVPNIDFWTSNVYRGVSFNNAQSNLFDDVFAATTKPFVIGEFGTDSYDNNLQQFDEVNQSATLKALWGEIHAEYNGRGAVSGGFIFQWVDGWWKHNGQWNATSLSQELHNAGFPSANTPDRFSNEESYGMLKILPGVGLTDSIIPKQSAVDLFVGNIW